MSIFISDKLIIYVIFWNLQEQAFDIEDFCSDIYNHFNGSQPRKLQLSEFFEFVDLEYRKIIKHVGTRWLSLARVIERLLICYPALQSYFISSSMFTLLYSPLDWPEHHIPYIAACIICPICYVILYELDPLLYKRHVFKWFQLYWVLFSRAYCTYLYRFTQLAGSSMIVILRLEIRCTG